MGLFRPRIFLDGILRPYLDDRPQRGLLPRVIVEERSMKYKRDQFALT